MMKKFNSIVGAAVLAHLLTLVSAQTRDPNDLPPTALPGLISSDAFFPGVTYRQSIPSQESIVGFACGQRAANASEIERCLKAWAGAAPDRTQLVEYARSHEGRPLHYLVVTSPQNLTRLDAIQAGYAKLGDPRSCSPAEARPLIDTLPAVAWLAYTIHGDETEGSDAALAVIYHLLAAQDPQVEKLLEDVVIIVDPLMNPDGRDRFVKMIAEHRGALPNVDDQSLLHSGYWPRGRGNHYLFDLNRDAIYATQPETRGRLLAIARFNPLLFVDAHGMGAQATHLFSPPRPPINPNFPKSRMSWAGLFARDQATALDRHQLLYYHGEWNEEWYPGYADGWASLRGAIGILYEQARIAEDGVRRPEGRILTYRESVKHHVLGSIANVTTLQAQAKPLREYFYASRQEAVDVNGPYARRTFAILPTANHSRLLALIDVLRLEGFELYRTTNSITVEKATNQWGQVLQNTAIPQGTLLVPNRQPLAHLLAAMLEFDPRMPTSVIEEERRELLQKDESKIYDTTAWNLTLMFGLEALELATDLPASAQSWPATEPQLPETGPAVESPVAYVIDGDDDKSVAAAARLMERGVQVRVADKPFRLADRDYARGSVVIAVLDNRTIEKRLSEVVSQTAAELKLRAQAIGTGLGAGDLPDLGGEHFPRIEPPRLALFGREGFNAQDFGATWFAVDHHLGIRNSQLDERESLDLGRYNVLVYPDGHLDLSTNQWRSLKEWVRAGGTLIAVAGAAAEISRESAEFSQVRLLPEVLDKLTEYEQVVFREWLGRVGPVPAPDQVWSHTASPGLKYPWQMIEGSEPDEKELKKRDAWQSLFMPQGAILAARVDTNQWLTFGCRELLPITASHQPVLMAANGVAAPIRYGFFAPADKPLPTDEKVPATTKPDPSDNKSESDKKEPDKKKEAPRIGWCALPEGVELRLRMSGLLWPEAAHRLANSAWVTREALGRGQIILFATPPTFRAATRGQLRVFLNAIVYGPGLGAAPVIRP
jgi:hypothetical protein